jgi:hypothetical protein
VFRWLFLASIILSSCATPQRDPFARYRQAFETVMRVSTIGVEIGFEKLKRPMVGVCHFAPDSRIVNVDPSYWAMISEYQREALIFHELGHCVLNLEHIDQNMVDGCPASNMSPEMLTDACYLAHRAYYARHMLKEIKTP